jgi:hypothetical protein
MAEHHPAFSHDATNRYLLEDDVSPSAVWLAVKKAICCSQKACLIFDDTLLDKRQAFKIELVRIQYIGNEDGVVKGVGIVNCEYVNLDTGEHWIIDWRVFKPDEDGNSKLNRVRDMFDDALENKKLPFRTVLMGYWYAAKEIMMLRGELVKIHGFQKDKKVRLFRVAEKNLTEHVATNDLSQNSGVAAKARCVVRWKVEQYHRQGRQMLGIEKCQCRTARRPEKPHRLRTTRAALPDKTRQKTENIDLCLEKTTVLRVYEEGTQIPINTDVIRLNRSVSCVASTSANCAI